MCVGTLATLTYTQSIIDTTHLPMTDVTAAADRPAVQGGRSVAAEAAAAGGGGLSE